MGGGGEESAGMVDLPWCNAVNPSLSVALTGHLCSSSSLIMGVHPTAAAR